MVLETLGLREPAQLCATSLSQMCLSARCSPMPIPVQSYCDLGWTLVMNEERGWGLPFISSSVAHRPLVSRVSSPACSFLPLQEADGESPGGPGELASLAAAAGLPVQSVFSCC